MVIAVKVVKPTALGTEHNEYDALIAEVGHRYGIAPQVVKAHVHHDSQGTFDPQSFRYEPRTWDRESFWKKRYTEDEKYRPFVLPDGPCLWPEDLAPRSKYFTLAYVPGGFPPWACRAVSVEPGNAPWLFACVEANDGWVKCSPPWLRANDWERCPTPPPSSFKEQKGPCGQRAKWWTHRDGGERSFSRCDRKFYCGGWEARDCTAESQSQWLLNQAPHWPAQTPVASSYGLLQIMYPTARYLGWKKDEPECAKAPSLLFDPVVSLDLGVGYVTSLVIEKGFSKQRAPQLGNQDKLNDALKTGLCFYNAGPGAKRAEACGNYPNLVWQHVRDYLPR